MTPLTGLIVLSVLGLASAGVYEQPEEPRFQSEDARSYMEQDSQGFMQQDPEGYVQQDNRAVYEEDNDVAEVEVHYQNSWDGKLHYECSSKDAIFRFQSIHDNRKEDRLWRFDCKKVVSNGKPNCNWNYGINKWDRPMSFRCPADYYLAGVRSRHNNRREDRIWDAKCCHVTNYCTKKCKVTGYVNNWDRPLYYSSRGVFTGLISYHNNRKEDRRWKVIHCNYSRC